MRNNTVGVAATANSGSTESSGIFLTGDGGSDIIAAITSNSIFQYNNHGIRMDFGDEINDGAVYNVTVTGNTVSNPGNLLAAFNGIHLNNGTVGATDNFTTCLDVGGAAALVNNVIGSSSSPAGQLSPTRRMCRPGTTSPKPQPSGLPTEEGTPSPRPSEPSRCRGSRARTPHRIRSANERARGGRSGRTGRRFDVQGVPRNVPAENRATWRVTEPDAAAIIPCRLSAASVSLSCSRPAHWRGGRAAEGAALEMLLAA